MFSFVFTAATLASIRPSVTSGRSSPLGRLSIPARYAGGSRTGSSEPARRRPIAYFMEDSSTCTCSRRAASFAVLTNPSKEPSSMLYVVVTVGFASSAAIRCSNSDLI